jgi:hypothetical protein
MKTKFVLIVFAGLWLALLCLTQKAEAQYQPPDGCLRMYCPNDWDPLTFKGSCNPDSVLVDTCKDSYTYRKLIAKRYFLIQLKSYYYPFDTVLKPNDVKKVSEISNNCSQLKQNFKKLENEYGTILFHGLYVEHSDSSLLANPLVLLSFDRYQNCDSLENVLLSIDSITFVLYQMRAGTPMSVSDNNVNGKSLILYPNPVQDILEIKEQMPFHAGKIQIISVEGVIVLETGLKDRLDVSGLPPGMYFLRINNFMKPFIIMR